MRWIRASYLQATRNEGLSLRVYASLVDALFESFSGYVTLVSAGIVLTVSAFLRSRDALAAGTMIAMILVAVSRLALYSRYRRYRASPAYGSKRRDIIGYELVYAASGALMAGAIGLTEAYGAIKYPGTASLCISIVITMGVAGAISGRNGSRPKILYAQVILIVLPFAAALAAQGTAGMRIVAGLIGVYVVATVVSTRAFYRSLRSSLDAAEYNRNLNRRIERQALMFDIALNNMTSGLLLLDEGRSVVIANVALDSVVGEGAASRSVNQSVHRFLDVVAQEQRLARGEAETFRRRFEQMIASAGKQTLCLSGDRSGRTLEFRLRRIPGQGTVINIDDISEKRKKEQDIFTLAHRDSLTGLPNRLSLSLHLGEVIAARQPGTTIAVLFIDIDHFKKINDLYGHSVGDDLLVEVARRLDARPGDGSYSSRISGDEFVIVFAGACSPEEMARSADSIIKALTQPYCINGQMLHVSASAGLAPLFEDAATPEELLRSADVALYAAKQAGRGRWLWFDRAMDEQVRARHELAAELRSAVGDGELHLAYQPIVEFRSSKVTTFEALARWTHPRRGRIPPSTFIPLAEESDVIHALGIWSLRQACEDAKGWDPSIKVAVNISPVLFKYASLSAIVIETLERTGLDAHRLEIEVTETALAEDFETMKHEIVVLSKHGVSIALDDFGTGYSSLSILHELPIDKIKLDRSFVQRLRTTPDTMTLIKSIVQMARTMRKEIVIEGVETAEELALISDAQARLIQGFYFSHPVPAAAVAETVARLEDHSAAMRKFITARLA